MSGSYSNLALFPDTTQYIFAWQSRGALNLYTDSWMGAPYTQCSPRWLNHNVAIATLSSKSKLSGVVASSTVGAAEGDTQVNWITKSDNVDHQNVHVATLNATLSLVTWESLISPKCEAVPLGCSGTFAGTSFQFVDSAGSKVGSETVDSAITVSGDMAVINGKICWPFVDQLWVLSAPKAKGILTQKMSFACAGVEGPVASSSVIFSTSMITTSSTFESVTIPSLIASSVSPTSSLISSDTPIVSETGGVIVAGPTDARTSTLEIISTAVLPPLLESTKIQTITAFAKPTTTLSTIISRPTKSRRPRPDVAPVEPVTARD